MMTAAIAVFLQNVPNYNVVIHCNDVPTENYIMQGLIGWRERADWHPCVELKVACSHPHPWDENEWGDRIIPPALKNQFVTEYINLVSNDPHDFDQRDAMVGVGTQHSLRVIDYRPPGTIKYVDNGVVCTMTK